MERITSRRNETILAVCALHRKADRADQGRLLVEGPKCVELALASDWVVEAVFFDERFLGKDMGQRLAVEAGKASLYSVTEPVIRKLSTTDSPCPVVAVARQKVGTLDDFDVQREGLYVVAHRTSDPGNLGTLLRVAVAAGARALIATGDACELTSPKVVRSSMGAIFHLPVVVVGEIRRVLEKLEETGISIVAAVPGATQDYTQVRYPAGVAFLLGEESVGLEPSLVALTDTQVSIPVAGPVGSLNVAVSGAMLLYEARRQREAKDE